MRSESLARVLKNSRSVAVRTALPYLIQAQKELHKPVNATPRAPLHVYIILVSDFRRKGLHYRGGGTYLLNIEAGG